MASTATQRDPWRGYADASAASTVRRSGIGARRVVLLTRTLTPPPIPAFQFGRRWCHSRGLGGPRTRRRTGNSECRLLPEAGPSLLRSVVNAWSMRGFLWGCAVFGLSSLSAVSGFEGTGVRSQRVGGDKMEGSLIESSLFTEVRRRQHKCVNVEAWAHHLTKW